MQMRSVFAAGVKPALLEALQNLKKVLFDNHANGPTTVDFKGLAQPLQLVTLPSCEWRDPLLPDMVASRLEQNWILRSEVGVAIDRLGKLLTTEDLEIPSKFDEYWKHINLLIKLILPPMPNDIGKARKDVEVQEAALVDDCTKRAAVDRAKWELKWMEAVEEAAGPACYWAPSALPSFDSTDRASGEALPLRENRATSFMRLNSAPPDGFDSVDKQHGAEILSPREDSNPRRRQSLHSEKHNDEDMRSVEPSSKRFRRLANSETPSTSPSDVGLLTNSMQLVERNEFPELSNDATALSIRMWEGSQNDYTAVTDGHPLSVHDMKTPEHGQFVSDNIVNLYNELLCKRAEDNATLPKIFAFSTFFYSSYRTRGFQAVHRWTKNIFDAEIVIIPVNMGNHWRTVTVDMIKKTIEYHDSLCMDGANVLKNIETFLKAESEARKNENFSHGWQKIVRQSVAIQDNGTDCGVFCCLFGDFAARRKRFDVVQRQIPYMRERMVSQLYHRDLNRH